MWISIAPLAASGSDCDERRATKDLGGTHPAQAFSFFSAFPQKFWAPLDSSLLYHQLHYHIFMNHPVRESDAYLDSHPFCNPCRSLHDISCSLHAWKISKTWMVLRATKTLNTSLHLLNLGCSSLWVPGWLNSAKIFHRSAWLNSFLGSIFHKEFILLHPELVWLRFGHFLRSLQDIFFYCPSEKYFASFQ